MRPWHLPMPLRRGAGVFTAGAAGNAVAFAMLVAAAGLLPPGEFGALGLAIALAVLCASLADAGTSVALVRFVNVEARDVRDVRRAAVSALAWKLLVAVGLVALAAAAPPALLERVLPPLAHVPSLPVITALAAGLLGLWTTVRAFDQARERFDALQRRLAAYALLRALAFAVVLGAFTVTPVAVLLALYVVPLGLLLAVRCARSAAVAWRARPLAHWRVHARFGGALLRYGAWVGLSSLCYLALARLPLFALAGAEAGDGLGHYAAALTFVAGLTLLGDASRTIALPGVMRVRDPAGRGHFRATLLRAWLPTLAVGLVALALTVAAYELVLGGAYAAGVELVLILGAAGLLTSWLGLHNALLHAAGRPELDAAVNAARVAALVALTLLLPATPTALALAYAGVLIAGELVLFGLVRGLDIAHSATGTPQSALP